MQTSIKMLNIFTEIILSEVGDLNSIGSFDYAKYGEDMYKFELETGERVDVEFTKLQDHHIKGLKISPLIDISKIKNYYNFSYSLEQETSQYKKESYGVLIKIMKTLLKITLDFLEDHKNSALLIFEELKTGGIGKKQKTLLYRRIIQMNLLSGYTVNGVTYTDEDGEVYGVDGKMYGTIIGPKK